MRKGVLLSNVVSRIFFIHILFQNGSLKSETTDLSSAQPTSRYLLQLFRSTRGSVNYLSGNSSQISYLLMGPLLETILVLLAHQHSWSYSPFSRIFLDLKVRVSVLFKIKCFSKQNPTLDIVPCPSSITLISCKWVHMIKLKSYGTLDHYKTQLAALGYKQEYGIDYSETFSPINKMTTVRNVLSITTSQSWPFFSNGCQEGNLPWGS